MSLVLGQLFYFIPSHAVLEGAGFFMAKKALITGITGQDGIYLASFLLEKGYAVTGLLSEGHSHSKDRLKWMGIEGKVEFRSCQLTDKLQVKAILEEICPEEIYNLAARSSVGASFVYPGETMHFNVLSVHSLLEAMRSSGSTAKLYQASSSEMFGNTDKLPVDENTPLCPVSPYAISKAAAHVLVKYYRQEYQLFCSSGILFNHESMLRPHNFVTKKILSAAVKISQGSKEKLKLGNMDVSRDWGYAPYYVQAMWRILQGPRADDYVIASGEAHSLEEFVKAVFAYLGLSWEKYVEVDSSLYRPADIRTMYGNAGKAEKELGWRYEMTWEKLVETLVKDEIYFQTQL